MRFRSLGVPGPRALVALTGCLCMFQFTAWSPRLLAPGILLLLAVWMLTAVSMRDGRRHAESSAWIFFMVAGVLGAVFTASKSQFLVTVPGLSLAVAVILAFTAIVAASGNARWGSTAFAVAVGVYTVVTVGDLATTFVLTDVQPLIEDGIKALLGGSSPYDITVANPFPPEDDHRLYGPGALENGRIMFGYPYLPAPLLLDIPAYLMGDLRWMHTLALVVAAVVAWNLATDRLGRAAAVLIVINPISGTVLVAYWVEPVIVAFLALTAWGMVRGSRWTGVVLGLFFASKQYAFSYLPALWSVARSSGWRTVGTAAAVGGVIVGGFALWDPGAFVHSAIEFQFIQPFRDDSMSLLPGLKERYGPIPEWLLTLSPVLGLLVSLLVAVRTRPGPTAFLLGIGLSLLFMVLLSKQAFMNYYFLMGAALLLAVITWPRDNPIPEPKA